MTFATKFWSKVDKSSDCWIWTAAKTGSGYGSFYLENYVDVRAHRYAYELAVGPIPEGLEIDHLCRNPICVNPSHLEPVTHAENLRRAWAANPVQFCKWGHLFDEKNTYYRKDGGRMCRACNNRRQKETQERRRMRLAQDHEAAYAR